MKVRKAGPFERILTLTIEEAAIDAAKKTAARRLAGEVKIKGFRPGRAPLKVVESAVGADTLRREAIDDALPAVLTDAIAETELAPAVMPKLEDIRDRDGGVEVDVLVTLWPTVKKLPKYRKRKVELDAPPVDDAAVEDQIERIRNQFAELEDVDREAFDGDFAIVDVATSRDGEEFAAGSANDMLFEVGSGMFLNGMDDALRGKAAGQIEEFVTTLPPSFGDDGGTEVSVRVLVKQVKAKRLPELTDEWVDDMTEFETATEMRRELEEQLIRIRTSGLRADYERLLLQELLDDLDLTIPEALLQAEMDSVFHRFAHRLEQQEVELGQYLELTGQDQESFLADLRSQAELNLKTRVMLEAVAEFEEIEVDDAELEEAITQLAGASEMEVEEYRTALAEGDREQALSGDILRRKAVDRVLELAVPVDVGGNEIDLEIEIDEPAPPGAADEAGGDGERSGEASDAAESSNQLSQKNRPTDGGVSAEVDE